MDKESLNEITDGLAEKNLIFSNEQDFQFE